MQDKDLSRILIEKGVIDEKLLEEINSEKIVSEDQAVKEKTVSRRLVNKGLVTIEQIVEILRQEDESTKSTTAYLNEIFDDKDYIADKYILVTKLGQGGMGVVYKAYEPSLKRYVAIKFLEKVSEDALKRFRSEAEMIAKLSHPNIVPIYEIGTHKNVSYIAMQYINGETLRDKTGKLSAKDFTHIIKNVCDAVSYAHSCNIIHRDIKPSNIIVDLDSRVYVMDFGIAKHLDSDSNITMTGDVIGTPMYMSPEQAKGQHIDFRSDIYSIGATLYSCVTGIAPYPCNSSIEIMNNVIIFDPVSACKMDRKVHRDLSVIIQKCMFKEPDLRYQTAVELKNDIDRFLQNEPVNARGPSIAYISMKKLQRNWMYLVAGVISVGVLIPFAVPYIKYTEESAKNAGMQEALKTALAKKQLATPHYEKGISFLNRAKYTRSPDDRKKVAEHFKTALYEFSKAVDLYDEYAEAFFYRGEILFRTSNFMLAATDFSRAIEFNPQFSDAYFMRLLSHFFEMHRSLVMNMSQYRDIMLSDCENLKSFNVVTSKLKCIEVLQVISERDVVDGKVQGLSARKIEFLEKTLDDAIKDDPSFIYSYILRLALSLNASYFNDSAIRKDKRDHLIDLVNKAIDIDPNYASFYQSLASIYFADRDFDKVIENIDVCRMIAPDNPFFLINKAVLISYSPKENKKKLVLKLLDESTAFEDKLKDPSITLYFYIRRAQLWRFLGNFDKADEDLDKALKFSTENNRKFVEEISRTIKKRNTKTRVY
ncbi:MAG: protein kinase [Planctomycetes bacterium]|nr:protein kinase [Planctomycetota bacterium]